MGVGERKERIREGRGEECIYRWGRGRMREGGMRVARGVRWVAVRIVCVFVEGKGEV